MVATFLGLCVLIVAVTVPTAGAINRTVRLWWQDFQDGKQWRPADYQLDTDADAKVFIKQLHQVVAAEVAPRDVPVEPTPIYNAWFAEWDADRRYAKHRVRQALRQPTQEMRVVFDEIVGRVSIPVPLPRRLAVAAEPLPTYVESYPVGGRMTMTRTEGLRHG
jgi:hypothetical protein